MNRYLAGIVCLAWFFSSILSAQPRIWTGSEAAANAQNNQFRQAGNWLGGVAPSRESSQVFFFGAADWTQPVVDQQQEKYYRVMSLTFAEDAESYHITGAPLVLGHESFIVNRSRFRQELAIPLLFAAAEPTGSVTVEVDTGSSGMVWSGGNGQEIIGRAHIVKTGESALRLQGNYDAIESMRVIQGELVLDSTSQASFPMQGGVWRVLGEGAKSSEISPFQELALSEARGARILLQPDGTKPLTLVVDRWLGHYGMMGYAPSSNKVTLHWDLSAKGSQVYFGKEAWQGSVTGANGVVPFATVTDATGVTGFVRLVRESPDERWLVSRAVPQHALPDTVEQWSSTRHYHVTLTEQQSEHRLVSAQPMGAGQEMGLEWPTLTLRGQGTLTLENLHLRAPNILLEEGKGDFVIRGPGIANHAGGYIHTTYAMRIFTYRDAADGALIVDTDHFGHVAENGETSPANVTLFDITHATLTKTGPGTLIFRSPETNIIEGVYVQQGRMQVESTGFRVTSRVQVFAGGTLAGNGQIGGGTRWVREGSGPVANGVRYTSVMIDPGGVLDGTPIQQQESAESRALSIHGSLVMHKGATLVMTLNEDVMAGRYTPLQVHTANPRRETAVTLPGHLWLQQLEKITTAQEIVLLQANAPIRGTLVSINGETLDTQDRTVIRHNGSTYTVTVDYSHKSEDGHMGVVVRITP